MPAGSRPTPRTRRSVPDGPATSRPCWPCSIPPGSATRSCCACSWIGVANDVQRKAAEESRDAYQRELTAAGYGTITTEIADAGEFWYAEDYHQQYLHKNPMGYCGLGGTGVSCPVGLPG
jgi:hypothetical protein